MKRSVTSKIRGNSGSASKSARGGKKPAAKMSMPRSTGKSITSK